MNQFKFKTNINCGNCIKSVTPFLNDLDSVEEWKVDTENADKILTVIGGQNAKQEAKDAVLKAGFKAEEIV